MHLRPDSWLHEFKQDLINSKDLFFARSLNLQVLWNKWIVMSVKAKDERVPAKDETTPITKWTKQLHQPYTGRMDTSARDTPTAANELGQTSPSPIVLSNFTNKSANPNVLRFDH